MRTVGVFGTGEHMIAVRTWRLAPQPRAQAFTQSTRITAGQAPVWAEHIPGAEVRILPGVGHLVFDESSEAAEAVAGVVGEELAV